MVTVRVESGCDIKYIQALLGHRDPKLCLVLKAHLMRWVVNDYG